MKTTRFYTSLTTLIFSASITIASAAWTPPVNPNAGTIDSIRAELRTDFAAKNYEDALAKHVWYHENALKYGVGQGGVRLSFVLNDWLKLGRAYPPALEKLKSIQNDLEKQLSTGKGDTGQFHDFSSINRLFDEVKRTSDLFILLDEKSPVLAGKVFHIAQPALVTAKEYTLCGKYIQSERAYRQAVDGFRAAEKFEANLPQNGRKPPSYARPSFSNACSTLVALLVKNNRLDEAKKIAADAAKELDDADFKAQLERALKGEVPQPWP